MLPHASFLSLCLLCVTGRIWLLGENWASTYHCFLLLLLKRKPFAHWCVFFPPLSPLLCSGFLLVPQIVVIHKSVSSTNQCLCCVQFFAFCFFSPSSFVCVRPLFCFSVSPPFHFLLWATVWWITECVFLNMPGFWYINILTSK